jgi:hypothetical protein
MRKISFFTFIVLISAVSAFAQNVGIKSDGLPPNGSAILDVSSTSKGFLPPRMTEAQRGTIASPAAGLIIWCSNCGASGELQVYNGTTWTNMAGGTAATVQLDLAIGDTYGGGKIAYILQSGDPGYNADVVHGLIAAPTDQSTDTQWGCVGSVLGAYGTALGTGNQNTVTIVAGCPTAGIAARLCSDLELGGYSDWYLPSKDELNKLYLNKAAIGSFANKYYFSSTEVDQDGIWVQVFDIGFQGVGAKNAGLWNVRAIRAF